MTIKITPNDKGNPAGKLAEAELHFGHGDGPNGHVALWLDNGMIVQCSASGDGSNIRPLAGYVSPTGWLRWPRILMSSFLHGGVVSTKHITALKTTGRRHCRYFNPWEREALVSCERRWNI